MFAMNRCQDETENETYISAIRCTKCPGYFLPENPIGDQHKIKIWSWSNHYVVMIWAMVMIQCNQVHKILLPPADQDMIMAAMVMMLGWGEEEGGMEVDNQFPPDCEARWICNECQMQAPKVRPFPRCLLTWPVIHSHRGTMTLWMRRLPLQ